MSVWTTVSIGASLRVVLMTRVSVTVFGMVVLVGDLINSHFYLLDGATKRLHINNAIWYIFLLFFNIIC